MSTCSTCEFEHLVILGLSFSWSTNLAVVSIFLRLFGALLLLINFVFIIDVFILSLAHSNGKVLLMMGKRFGLFGLCVLTNARTFLLLLLSFALALRSSSFGID